MAFSFEVPYEYDNPRIATACNQIMSNGVAYPYFVGSVQPASNSTMAFVAISYFPYGKPPIDVEKAAFLNSFEKSRGKVSGQGVSATVMEYNATLWYDAKMPYTDPVGLLAHMPAILAFVDVDSNRTVSIVAQAPAFDLISRTLRVGA